MKKINYYNMSSVNETNGNAVNLIEEKNKKIEELRKIYNEINMKNKKIKENIEKLNQSLSPRTNRAILIKKEDIVLLWNSIGNKCSKLLKGFESKPKIIFCVVNQIFCIVSESIKKFINDLYVQFSLVLCASYTNAIVHQTVNECIKENIDNLFFDNSTNESLYKITSIARSAFSAFSLINLCSSKSDSNCFFNSTCLAAFWASEIF